jgi:hypothetical protein
MDDGADSLGAPLPAIFGEVPGPAALAEKAQQYLTAEHAVASVIETLISASLQSTGTSVGYESSPLDPRRREEIAASSEPRKPAV